MGLRNLSVLLTCLVSFSAYPSILEETFPINTKEGYKLQVRLNHVPSKTPLPTLIILGGAGPLNVDMTLVAPNTPNSSCPKLIWKNDCRLDKYLAEELAEAGFAVVRMGRRGTWVDETNPYYVKINWEENASSTISTRMDDFQILLESLEKNPTLSIDQIYLMGVSEGSVISHLIVNKLGSRLKGIVQVGAVLNALSDIHRMQTVDVIYGQLLKVADRNKDARISKNEFIAESILAYPPDHHGFEPTFRDRMSDYKLIGLQPSFDYFDLDKSGTILREELSIRLYQDLYQPLLTTLENNDVKAFNSLPAFSFKYKYNTFEQFKSWYSVPEIGQELIHTKIPVSLLFGMTDVNTPTSQLDWFLPLLWKAKNPLIRARVLDTEDGHYGPDLIMATVEEFKRWLQR
jgi:pimeloyl-ACP methyl ester carboxylesterase